MKKFNFFFEMNIEVFDNYFKEEWLANIICVVKRFLLIKDFFTTPAFICSVIFFAEMNGFKYKQ